MLQHMKERRREVPEANDRLTLHAAEKPMEIDWGEFGEDAEMDEDWPSGNGRRDSSNSGHALSSGFIGGTGKLAVLLTGRVLPLFLIRYPLVRI